MSCSTSALAHEATVPRPRCSTYALADVAELRRHNQLRELKVHNGFGLVVEDLPELPALRSLELGGTRVRTATAVAQRYRGTAVSVDIWRAEPDEWLAAHMDNPFRDWVDDGEEFASAACQAYDQARVAVEAITPAAIDRVALAEAALRGLVSDLNAVNERFGGIDTLYRDQVADAFHGIARLVNIPIELERLWFDDGRRF